MRGWFYTIFGGLLAGAGTFVPGAGIITAIKVTLGAGLLALVSWGSVAATNWWHSDKLTVAESNQRCADTMTIAAVNAKEGALIALQFHLRSREEMVVVDEEALKAKIAGMERDREEAKRAGADGAIVPADDEWLQRYRARHTGAGRR